MKPVSTTESGLAEADLLLQQLGVNFSANSGARFTRSASAKGRRAGVNEPDAIRQRPPTTPDGCGPGAVARQLATRISRGAQVADTADRRVNRNTRQPSWLA